jgi:hypothetical protein
MEHMLSIVIREPLPNVTPNVDLAKDEEVLQMLSPVSAWIKHMQIVTKSLYITISRGISWVYARNRLGIPLACAPSISAVMVWIPAPLWITSSVNRFIDFEGGGVRPDGSWRLAHARCFDTC